MKKFAFIFPGQGSQYPGMGKDFAEAFSQAKHTFQEADDLLKENLSQIIFEGPADDLTKTRNSQCAIFVLSMAILRSLPVIEPFVCSGLSLGEYSALCASGKLGFKETLQLVQRRAHFMNDACEKIPGTMAAVLGMSSAQIDEALYGAQDVWVANYNCPGQIVISGTKNGVENASVLLKEAGAKRVIPLQVHGAFHSGLMKEAQKELTPFIDEALIVDSKICFVMNAIGDFVSSTNEIRKLLAAQVTSSVRWEQGIEKIELHKPDVYLEIGCGKTLSAFNRKIGVNGATHSIEKVADISQLENLCNC